MKHWMLLFCATAALAQLPRQTRTIGNEDFRGVSVVSQDIAWASGTHGTYLRTIDGHSWFSAQVPEADKLDFRGIVAFSADEAFLMSSGPGELSRIYHTGDAGQHWQLQFTASNAKSFLDSIAFWDRTHGVALGDPISDETGALKFQLLMTEDGQTWTSIPPSQLPPALEGEGAFAASNTCIAILSHVNKGMGTTLSRAADEAKGAAALAAEAGDPNLWFATGGKAARVFHSPDRGRTWQVAETPILHGPDSAGIFSITFRDPLHGAIAGGDYKHPDKDGPNLALTNDGGKTWTLSKIFPQAYFSAVAYDQKSISDGAVSATKTDDQARVRLFLAAPKFLFDFRPPRNPTRISPPGKSSIRFNALSPYPDGGVLAVGPKGSLATIP